MTEWTVNNKLNEWYQKQYHIKLPKKWETKSRIFFSTSPTPSFSPIDLFAASEPGVWYDPSDLTTLFTDTAGTTPVTTPGNTVALMLDKSKGGVGTNGASRRNLLTFSQEFDDSIWIKPGIVTTGMANVTTAPDGTLTADQLIETAVASTHIAYSDTTGSTTTTVSIAAKASTRSVATISCNNGSVNWAAAAFDLSAPGAAATAQSGGTFSGTSSITPLGDGWYRCVLSVTSSGTAVTQVKYGPSNVANPTFGAFGDYSYTGNGSGIYIWGAQLEVGSTATAYQPITASWAATIPGNHAVQATFANRPLYGIVPFGGRRNLLTFSEQFDNAAWATAGGTLTSAQSDPIGGNTAFLYTVGGATQAYNVGRSATGTFTTTSSGHAQSFYVKPNGASYVQITYGSSSNPNNAFCNFDLTDGSVGSSASCTGAITLAGNGYYRVSVSVDLDVGAGLFGGALSIVPSKISARAATFVGDNTSGIFLWGAQLELGSTATAYQRVTTQYDVTEAGVPSCSYLFFDGASDSMATSTITPGIDKVQVFAGARKLSNTATRVLVGLSTVSTNNGSFELFAPVTTSGEYQFNSTGTVFAFTRSTAISVPITNVLTALGDISADRATLRIDGTQASQATTDQGTGNFLPYPLYIGARGGASLEFNGNLFSLITRFGPNLDAPTITATETWVADKTGINIANNISPTIFARDDTAVLDRFNQIIERRA